MITTVNQDDQHRSKNSTPKDKLALGPSRYFLVGLGAAVCVGVPYDAYARDTTTQEALVARVHADLTRVRHSLFDITKVEKLSGVRLEFYRQGSITNEKIFRPIGKLRWPYMDIEYELRSNGAWAGLTLSLDRKYCISPGDLNNFFPMGEGAPQTNDHSNNDDFEIGFGNERNKVWIVYQDGMQITCARQFKIEATR